MSDKPIRIALTGKLRSGKSEIANYLLLEYDFMPVSFANGLKRIADDLFSHLYEPICSDGGKTVVGYRKPRALLQSVGQKMREIDEDVWIRQAEELVKIYEDSRSIVGVVIDDLRQPNEYEWARENNFVIIRVEANEDTRLERARQVGDDFSEEDLAHDTEQYSDKFDVDYVITNDGGLDELEQRVDEIMSEIKAKGGR